MTRKPYLSDVSDDAWAFMAPYLALMTEVGATGEGNASALGFNFRLQCGRMDRNIHYLDKTNPESLTPGSVADLVQCLTGNSSMDDVQ